MRCVVTLQPHPSSAVRESVVVVSNLASHFRNVSVPFSSTLPPTGLCDFDFCTMANINLRPSAVGGGGICYHPRVFLRITKKPRRVAPRLLA